MKKQTTLQNTDFMQAIHDLHMYWSWFLWKQSNQYVDVYQKLLFLSDNQPLLQCVQ